MKSVCARRWLAAAVVCKAPHSHGPRGAGIIAKGMNCSPLHGDIDFTVPVFDQYLRRIRN